MLSCLDTIPERDRRMDERTDRLTVAISISRVSIDVLTRDKKRKDRTGRFAFFCFLQVPYDMIRYDGNIVYLHPPQFTLRSICSAFVDFRENCYIVNYYYGCQVQNDVLSIIHCERRVALQAEQIVQHGCNESTTRAAVALCKPINSIGHRNMPCFLSK